MCWWGEASHPGPSRRSSQRSVEGRDVMMRRCSRSVEVEATQVDSDSDEFPSKSFTCVQQRKRRKTRIHSDSEASAQFSRGRFAPLSSDSKSEVDDFFAGVDQIDAGRRALPEGVDSPSSPPPDVVDGLEQDLCHPPPKVYAMSEGEECPPTARGQCSW